MKKHLQLGLSSFLAALVAAAPTASADTKSFAWTYPARTISEGELEAELYTDAGLNGWDDPSTEDKVENDWGQVDWKHQLEFEYGITDAWDFGFYNVLVQKPFSTMAYDGVKLRTRFNFAEGKDWLLQPGIYFEVGYFGDAIKLEEMFILSLAKKRFETSVNLKAEQEFGGIGVGEGEVEHELYINYAAGFHLGAQTVLSLEYEGKAKFEAEGFDYLINYLGPTIHVAAGLFYWNIGVQPQLGSNDEKAAVRLRSVFSVLF